MKICDRCRETDRKVNIHRVVIWQEKADLCTDCEKELQIIFKNFITKGANYETNR